MVSIDGLLFSKAYNVSVKKFSEESCLLTLKDDAKLKGKLAFALKNNIRNLVYFHTRKFTLWLDHFCPQHIKISLEKYRNSKNDMRYLVSFHPTTQNSQNFSPMGFFSKVYEVWAKKIHRSYFSWNWAVMKNDMINWVNFP